MFKHRDARCGRVECRPLYSASELFDWTPGGNEWCRASVPLYESYAEATPVRPKVLVCHDMKGGYLNDRFVEGSDSLDTYRFTHWWLIDTFVYFSHHLVTIPPPCWIDAGHKHGVKVLGTLITEGSEDPTVDGSLICATLFDTKRSYRSAADQLVCIADYYQFDGWLLNIENPIQPCHMEHLKDFVGYLTQAMHSKLPHSEVIWYDSVTEVGDLKWQNELNEDNKCFFDRSDGIFLNYGWTQEGLMTSCQVAPSDRQSDIYVGCDVFGRGCLGGGMFDTNVAVQVAAECNLSIALFAPAWTFETLDKSQFVANEAKFWSLLAKFCPRRAIKYLPLLTNFCQGWGDKYYVNGKRLGDHPWTSLSLQQVQPMKGCVSEPLSTCSLSYTTCDGLNGGGCLQISAEACAVSAVQQVRLFLLDTPLTNNTVQVSYTFKSRHLSQLSLLLRCRSKTDESRQTSFHLVNEERTAASPQVDGLLVTIPVTSSTLTSGVQLQESNAWITRIYTLSELNNLSLQEISVVVSTGTEQADIWLGQLKVVSLDNPTQNEDELRISALLAQGSILGSMSILQDCGEPLPDLTDTPLTELTAEMSSTKQAPARVIGATDKLLIILLSWVLPKELMDITSHYNVFELHSTSAEWCFLGMSPRACFSKRISVLDASDTFWKKIQFKVDIVLRCGRVIGVSLDLSGSGKDHV